MRQASPAPTLPCKHTQVRLSLHTAVPSGPLPPETPTPSASVTPHKVLRSVKVSPAAFLLAHGILFLVLQPPLLARLDAAGGEWQTEQSLAYGFRAGVAHAWRRQLVVDAPGQCMRMKQGLP